MEALPIEAWSCCQSGVVGAEANCVRRGVVLSEGQRSINFGAAIRYGGVGSIGTSDDPECACSSVDSIDAHSYWIEGTELQWASLLSQKLPNAPKR